ncbi:hypothetical protein FACS1894168_3050 [Deltaproteobacteria bacterium]|nr:hypothetical protein FACS1894168_3050 [Deltaproteobacteria bacterium]
MDKLHKEILQVTKEIIVKFIESGRVSPANFDAVFPAVYKVVRSTLLDALVPSSPNGFDDSGDIPG